MDLVRDRERGRDRDRDGRPLYCSCDLSQDVSNHKAKCMSDRAVIKGAVPTVSVICESKI